MVLREKVVIVLVVFLITQVHQPPLLYMLPIDVSSQDEDISDLDLFIKLAEWSEGIPHSKYQQLQALLEERGIKFLSVRRKEA